jgi:geranylgeranyl pyrophosphate synthase
MTLPVIHLLARDEARAAASPGRRRSTLDRTARLRGWLVQSRSIDYVQRVAGDFVERAKEALRAFPPSDARDALMYLPDYVVSRDR